MKYRYAFVLVLAGLSCMPLSTKKIEASKGRNINADVKIDRWGEGSETMLLYEIKYKDITYLLAGPLYSDNKNFILLRSTSN